MHVGTDIVRISAFAAQLRTPGSTFERVFTERELRDCEAKACRDSSLAARWAAKEAYVKAWAEARFGSPPALAELDFREIEVCSDAFGRVAILPHGEVERHGPAVQSLSLSHDGDYAVAVCLVDEVR